MVQTFQPISQGLFGRYFFQFSQAFLLVGFCLSCEFGRERFVPFYHFHLSLSHLFSGSTSPIITLSSPCFAIARKASFHPTLGFLADLRFYDAASESNLVSADLEKYAYIHIATHGFVNEKDPGLSGLFFFPSSDSTLDNILYLNEINNLKLSARLVVLSACETGLGKIAAGEGILGFSRAFFVAGARNLLLSLWKVNDVSTTELMTHFYKFHLENGIPLAASLRNAKLSLIANPRTSHPYFWAPFVLGGK